MDATPALSVTSSPVPKSMRTIRPFASRMTFCALTSRWTRPAPMDGGQRAAKIEADRRDLLRAHRAVVVEHVLEGASSHELHP